MTRLRLPVGLLLAMAALALVTATPGRAAECKNVRADIVATLTGPASTTGQITSGLLKGSTSFAGAFTGPVDATTLGYTGTLTITTDRGEVDITDAGVLDVAHNVFAELDRIVGGTGRFQGASGILFISETFDPASSTFEGKVTGEVCVAQ